MSRRLLVFLLDITLWMLLAYAAYIWASWTDPYHRTRDQARIYWHGFRVMWKVSSLTAQHAMYLESRYRKVTS